MKNTNWFMWLSCLIMLMIETPIMIMFLLVGLDYGYNALALSSVGLLWYTTTAILIGWWCGAVSRAVCVVAEMPLVNNAPSLGEFIKDKNGMVYRMNGVFGNCVTYEAVSGVEMLNVHPE